ncbi:MAG: 4Fe-4S dicluster domain-containing protein [Myxococcales bacterium]|nr:MAG: 4Fe-4S dicluster domain-containing protein [Myxococcales bacterium]
MGHMVNTDREYRLLQQRLDSTVTGAPYSPTFMQILKLLFRPEEARLANKLPLKLQPLSSISGKLGLPPEELGEKITDMARRGLVIDMELNDKRYVILAPVVIGFFEYTFMRTRDELPMKELSKLFDTYMKEEKEFAHSVFQGQTQIGRALVREEALPEEDFSEILDWERASSFIEQATDIGVSLCACRHHHSHLGNACERPQRTCLSFNYGAIPMINAGLAERISVQEALKILQECKELGLAQVGDNVKRRPVYMCNCCGCCCGMMQAIRTFNIKNAIVTSNWIMHTDPEVCKGCGKCAKACPVDAIELKTEMRGQKKKAWAVLDESLCLGCGVCYSACKHGAIAMRPRAKRVYTPETVFDKTVAMAIERGKISTLLFDNPEKFSHRALARMVGLIEKSPPYKAAMAIAPLRSVFLNALVKGAKTTTGSSRKSLGG